MTNRMFLYSSGIYQIRNLINGKIYIGQSMRLADRRYNHFRLLAQGRSHTLHLQNAYNKYGGENFVFEVLIYCDVDLLDYYEQTFVNKLQPQYNIRKDVTSNRGHKVSKETRETLSNINKGRVVSDETRRKIGDAHRGMRHSEEVRKKQSERMMGHKINVGKVKSIETLQKLSLSLKESWKHRARTFSDDIRKKFSVAHINSIHTKRGEENPKSKLNRELVIEIRHLYDGTDLTYKQIGNRFGISPTSVMSVCSRKTWKHVQ